MARYAAPSRDQCAVGGSPASATRIMNREAAVPPGDNFNL